VSGAKLGEIFAWSTAQQSREHCSKGRIFRLGNGYDFRRSVQAMLDYERIPCSERRLAGATRKS
jgi:hypothetical protein